MNLLQRALIEKAGHDGGFEHVLPSPEVEQMRLGWSRRGLRLQKTPSCNAWYASLLASRRFAWPCWLVEAAPVR